MTLLKGKPKKPPPMRVTRWDRAREHVSSHKRAWGWTLGSLATLATILGVVVPWVVSSVRAVDDRYEKSENARLEIAKLQASIVVNDKSYRRTDAWLIYGQQDMRALVVGKWVTDCAVQRMTRKQTPIEAAACENYAREWDKAQTRAESARKDAAALSK